MIGPLDDGLGMVTAAGSWPADGGLMLTDHQGLALARAVTLHHLEGYGDVDLQLAAARIAEVLHRHEPARAQPEPAPAPP